MHSSGLLGFPRRIPDMLDMFTLANQTPTPPPLLPSSPPPRLRPNTTIVTLKATYRSDLRAYTRHLEIVASSMLVSQCFKHYISGTSTGCTLDNSSSHAAIVPVSGCIGAGTSSAFGLIAQSSALVASNTWVRRFLLSGLVRSSLD